ncbi:MAG: hypothetical protein NTX88_10150, partial [Candidatus Atribacteria bacterium]|nr:hypothetical protein [Candidatus Atribacteria bacterium]
MSKSEDWWMVPLTGIVFIALFFIYRAVKTSLDSSAWLQIILLTTISGIIFFFLKKFAGFFLMEKMKKFSFIFNQMSAIDMLVALG